VAFIRKSGSEPPHSKKRPRCQDNPRPRCKTGIWGTHKPREGGRYKSGTKRCG